MNPATFVAIYLPLIIVLIISAQRKKNVNLLKAAKNHKKKKGESIMEAVAQKYMGKGVSVTTVSETHVGILTGHYDGWITLTYKGKDTEINCDYIVKILPRDLPKEKHVIE